jgi:hypothetical protein
MRVIIERCCGLDVHQETVVACLLIGAPGDKWNRRPNLAPRRIPPAPARRRSRTCTIWCTLLGGETWKCRCSTCKNRRAKAEATSPPGAGAART